MHWSPEHAASLAQWPEQHLDVSSTTSPPSALKHEPFSAARRGLHAPPGYPWASDDISALTASSLLKRYAEKYVSGVDLAYERAAPTPAGFAEPTGFLKTEPDPWPPLDCYGSLEKVPATGSVTVVSNLTSDSYSAGAEEEG
uniref:Uncharacterized protein n=1 Tax=Knipowitschia caucasica TaxID=637954 RepID=A0AAV2MPL6_KNICA